MSATRKVGVAVIGLGRMGSTHVHNLRQSGRAIVKKLVGNVDLANAKLVAGRFEFPPPCVTSSQLGSVLEDKSIEAVVISSPTAMHESQIKAALEAGKSVFCEKPITSCIKSTIDCYDLAEKLGKPLFCAFHRRFDPSFNKMRDCVQDVSSGQLRLLRISSHDISHPPVEYLKTSGGILNDSTIHDLDMALWMTGSPAKSIYVHAHAFHTDVRACDDHDLVVITVIHQDGCVSVIDNGRRSSFGYDQRAEALCEDATLIVSNQPSHSMSSLNGSRVCVPPSHQIYTTRYGDAYVQEMEHFLDVINGTPLKVTRKDTISVMTLVEAAQESIRTGAKVDIIC